MFLFLSLAARARRRRSVPQILPMILPEDMEQNVEEKSMINYASQERERRQVSNDLMAMFDLEHEVAPRALVRKTRSTPEEDKTNNLPADQVFVSTSEYPYIFPTVLLV